MALIEVQSMTNKIEELGKVLMEIDALNERIVELEKIKKGLKFAITMEQRELQMQQTPEHTTLDTKDKNDGITQ